MLSEIPGDIWRCVAGFLPTAFLLTLYSVNPTFLEIVRETRYQAISLTTYKSAKRLIKHVKESKLVHSVRVQPWMVEPKRPKHSLASSTWKLFHACVSPSYGFEEPEAEITRRLQKQTQRIADLIKGLSELHKYHIDWDEGPSYHPEFFSTLLQRVIPTIGHRLHTLILKIPLSQMPLLPSLAFHLPNVENLSVTVHTGQNIPIYISHKMEGLVVFVNTLLRQLRTLALYTTPTSTYLDLGPLFCHLGYGRRLTSFTLCIPFDGGHLADATPLREFLFKHRSTLESLNLSSIRAAARPNRGAEMAKFWIRDAFKNHPFYPSLSHLSLSLRPLRADLGPLLRCLLDKRMQLRMLKLSDRPLEYADLGRILGVLDSPPLLRVLSLRIKWLSPEIVDLIAARLPELTALDLNFPEVVHQEPPSSDTCSLRSEDSVGLTREGELMLFCQLMNVKRYPNWNLTRLAVPESPRWQLRWLGELEHTFVGCIPALSFSELMCV